MPNIQVHQYCSFRRKGAFILPIPIGVRVSKEEEVEGLDLSQYGEEGYIFES